MRAEAANRAASPIAMAQVWTMMPLLRPNDQHACFASLRCRLHQHEQVIGAGRQSQQN
jgi:hypothetical protein